MAWIESHQELSRHPKTKRLARLLNVSIPSAVGYLHMLWWWAMDFAQDGDLSQFDSDDVADALMWDGHSDDLVRALATSGFIDIDGDSIHIHDWDEYAGRLIEKREQNAERKRKSRERHKGVTHTSHRQERDFVGSHRATAPNQTAPNQTEPKQEEIVSKETSVTRAEVAVSLVTTEEPSSSSLDSVFGQVARLYESEGFGPLSDTVREQLVYLNDEFGADWLILGMKEAVLQNKRRLKYVAAVLQNWRSDGGPRTSETKQDAKSRAAPLRAGNSLGSEGTNANGQQDPRYAKFYELFPDAK